MPRRKKTDEGPAPVVKAKKLNRKITLQFTPKQFAQLVSPDVDTEAKAQEILTSLRVRMPRLFATLYDLYRSDRSISVQDLAIRYGLKDISAYSLLKKGYDYSLILRETVRGEFEHKGHFEYFLTPSVKGAFRLWEAQGKQIYMSVEAFKQAMREAKDDTVSHWVQ